MIVVIVGRMLSAQDFKTDVGIGSNSHDVGVKQSRGLPLNFVSALKTSTWVFVFKTERLSLITVILT